MPVGLNALWSATKRFRALIATGSSRSARLQAASQKRGQTRPITPGRGIFSWINSSASSKRPCVMSPIYPLISTPAGQPAEHGGVRSQGDGAFSASFGHCMQVTGSYLSSASLQKPQAAHLTISPDRSSLAFAGQSGSQIRALAIPMMSARPSARTFSANSGVRIFPAVTIGISCPAPLTASRTP